MCLMHLCLHVAVDMGHSVCPLTSYKYKLVLGARDVQISCSREGRVFTNQWWTNSGLPASQTSLLLSGAPSAEQASWAALISSVVFFLFYFFFRSESRWGTCVCVWDAGMHGANPPLSSNAWTVSKTLLLLLLPSMLIRRGLGWGGRGLHRCNSRLRSQGSECTYSEGWHLLCTHWIEFQSQHREYWHIDTHRLTMISDWFLLSNVMSWKSNYFDKMHEFILTLKVLAALYLSSAIVISAPLYAAFKLSSRSLPCHSVIVSV